LRHRHAEAARDVVKSVTAPDGISHRFANGGQHCRAGRGAIATTAAAAAKAQLLSGRKRVAGRHTIDTRERIHVDAIAAGDAPERLAPTDDMEVAARRRCAAVYASRCGRDLRMQSPAACGYEQCLARFEARALQAIDLTHDGDRRATAFGEVRDVFARLDVV